MYLLLFLLFFCSSAYADQAVFYDRDSGKQIVDVSGDKTIEQIKSEFGLTNVQKVNINEKNESVRVKNGELVKYDFVKESLDSLKDKEEEKAVKISKVKQKLGLTDQEFIELKEALN